MIRYLALSILLLPAIEAQEPAGPTPGWQERLERASKSPAAWKARRDEVRRQILVAAGLWPEFERPPIKAEVFGKVDGDGYTIERVDVETLPGLHLTGSLYRPKMALPPFPAILSPHGHWKEGRYTQEKDGNLPARGISYARNGFVCFMYDMVGYGDFKQLPHKFEDAEFGQGLFGLQTWNSLRAVDFVVGLPEVDASRIGVTGASGGGTQTFILTAIDDRVACAAPVNMVAAEFQGGCPCENAPFLRIGLNNVEIAAMTAPRPLMLIAATGDWTKNVPTLEGPALEKTYRALGVPEKFRTVQFNAPHNYNQDSRETVYAWMVRWLQGGPDLPRLAEAPVPPVKREELAVWTPDHKLPENAVDAEGLKKVLRERIASQLSSLQPKDGKTLAKYRELMEPAWRLLLTTKTAAGPDGGAGRKKATVLVVSRPEDAAPYQEALRDSGQVFTLVTLSHASQPETPAGGDATQRKTYPVTFYRTELARQVQDVIDMLALAGKGNPTQIHLVGLGEAGLPALLARAVAGTTARVSLTIADLSAVDAALQKWPHPALQRLGGWAGAALLAPPGLMVIHGKKLEGESLRESYKAAGREGALTVSEAAWSRDRILEELGR